MRVSLGGFASELATSVDCGCTGPREGEVHRYVANLLDVLADNVIATVRLGGLVLDLRIRAEVLELIRANRNHRICRGGQRHLLRVSNGRPIECVAADRSCETGRRAAL